MRYTIYLLFALLIITPIFAPAAERERSPAPMLTSGAPRIPAGHRDERSIGEDKPADQTSDIRLQTSDAKPALPLIMKLADVKVGMKGYGKTVFEGTRIERFGAEVIGILKNITPKHDAILIRCNHHITDKAGIIQGMSGSPIYLVVDAVNEPEGRLVGALAFGWSFNKDPIAGVTPIEYMIKEMNKPLEQDESKADDIPDRWLAQNNANAKPTLETTANTDISNGMLRPLLTPVFVSGFHPKLMPYLEKDFKEFNLYPIQAGGGSADITVNEPLEPGSAMGIAFTRGDMDLTGIGTVTYVDGDKIAAFGHSMDLVGETLLPLTTAYMYCVIPCQSLSFKLGVAGQTIGSITQDRRTCVTGVIGKKTPMFPVRIKVTNLKTGYSDDFNIEMIHHRNITPGILRYALYSALMVTEPNDDRATIEATVNLKIKGIEPVTFKRIMGSPSGAIWPVLSEIGSDIFDTIWRNPYQDIKVETLDVDIKISNEDHSAMVKSIWLEKDTVKPGELVKLSIQLQPYKKPEVMRTVQFMIPEDTADQDINIVVTGGGNVMPELPTPTNPQEMVNLLKSLYENNNLITVVPIKSTNLLYQGNNLKGLPNSVLSALINQSREDVAVRDHGSVATATLIPRYELINGVLKIFHTTDYIIHGSDSIRLKVRNK
jgi:hypothetical protein